MSETIGQRVKRLRQGRGLGVNELGRLIGKKPGYVSNLEADVYGSPRGDTLTALARALHVTLDELTADLAPKDAGPQEPPQKPNLEAAIKLLSDRGEVTPRALRVVRSMAAESPVDFDLGTWIAVVQDVARKVR